MKIQTMRELLAEMRGVARGEDPAPSDAAQPSAESAEAVRTARVARPVEDLDEETVKAIAGSSVPATYNELDEIIRDWTPP